MAERRYLARRAEVHRLAEELKDGLDQESALVLGFVSNSFLVEDEASAPVRSS